MLQSNYKPEHCRHCCFQPYRSRYSSRLVTRAGVDSSAGAMYSMCISSRALHVVPICPSRDLNSARRPTFAPVRPIQQRRL